MKKTIVYQALKDELDHRIHAIQSSIEDSQAAMRKETKSTAGDKHETGRAMAQLEQEKLGKQLSNTIHLRDMIAQINPEEHHSSIQFGSLVQTNLGCFFFTVGIGKLIIGQGLVFCSTMASPIGQAFKAKQVGDIIKLNTTSYEILSIS